MSLVVGMVREVSVKHRQETKCDFAGKGGQREGRGVMNRVVGEGSNSRGRYVDHNT